jgi:alkanesulfonate monooxygenase
LIVYTSCPQFPDYPDEDFRTEVFQQRIGEVAGWAEDAGLRGMLLYTDNISLDPWAVAHLIIRSTKRLVPLIAVNPMYMHPFIVAQMAGSLAFLHERGVDLNLVTGGFLRQHREMGGKLDHDERYDRLAEFGEIISRLLTKDEPLAFDGRYYTQNGITLVPPLEPRMAPRIYVSGASEACVRTQHALGATRLTYPRELGTYVGAAPLANCGLRLGIIARDSAEEAWRVAHDRFPVDLEGEELHDLATELVESEWHLSLSADALRDAKPMGNYWLYPFRAYHTFCPYFVGTYGEVSALLARYLRLGVSALILDSPSEADDLRVAMTVIEAAEALAAE